MPYSDPAKQRAWRERNAERARAQTAEWKRKHPERLRLHSRSQRLREPDKMKAAVRDWRERNPDRDRAIQARRRAVVVGAPVNDFTAAEWTDVKLEFNQHCAYCHQSHPLTQDHLQPLSRGGAHTKSNIVPACQSCNSRKGSKTLLEFLRYQLEQSSIAQPAPPAA
jgi:5-methylcytosine-specific restriction endonuclease McrA